MVYSLVQSRKNSEEFDLFTLDDVDKAFDNIIQVKYAQTVQLKGTHAICSLTIVVWRVDSISQRFFIDVVCPGAHTLQKRDCHIMYLLIYYLKIDLLIWFSCQYDYSFSLSPARTHTHTHLALGKGHGLTITAHAAGHMVGGAMWKIGKDEEEDIVYAIDYNHKKER